MTLPFSFFTTAKSLGYPRAHQRGDAGTGGYAGETSPSPPPISSRCLPRRKPEAMGGEAVNRVAVPSSLHDGRLLPTTATMFP